MKRYWTDGETGKQHSAEMTPEEIADWEAGQAIQSPAPLPPLSRQQIAAVRLNIDGWNADISRSQGLALAFMLEENVLACVYFEDEQPDTAYIVTPAEGVTRHTDHIEVSVAGPTSLAFIVERVQ